MKLKIVLIHFVVVEIVHHHFSGVFFALWDNISTGYHHCSYGKKCRDNGGRKYCGYDIDKYLRNPRRLHSYQKGSVAFAQNGASRNHSGVAKQTDCG